LGRKKKRSGDLPQDQPFERIEIHVPIGFTARIDAAAMKVGGLSRSAFIRNAILAKLKEVEEDGNL
jgi:metal-responsive CopG/Arc/MetJ family transcriptional regulator